ncbi:MAG: hypothetical protein WC333_07165 [Dehalococcoidia bacterium]|jgi:hypothetical protein
MVENAIVKCVVHKDREAVGTCAFCGEGYCLYCRSIVEGKAACSACAAKWYGIPNIETKGIYADGHAAAKNHDAASRSAAAVLLLLSSITYIPMLVQWDEGRSTFIGLLVLAIVSFGFQAALIVRNNLLIWWGSFVLWIVNMIVANIIQIRSLDPTGMLSLVIMLFFFPFIIGIMVWISYRSEKLMFRSMVIAAVLAVIIWGIMQSAFMHY